MQARFFLGNWAIERTALKLELDVDLRWLTILIERLGWNRGMFAAQFYFLSYERAGFRSYSKWFIVYQRLFWTVYFAIGLWCCYVARNGYWFTDTVEQFAKSISLPSFKSRYEKSNTVVFRKGGYLGERERWRYDSVVLPVVNVSV